ncbi:MAG: YbjN domain-containing protein [Anaerolineae bacterium]
MLYDVVQAYFEVDNWRYCRVGEAPTLMLDISGRNGHFTCYARVREEEYQVIFYAVCPVNAPENKRHGISEFISRANFGLVIGNFEMDFDNGEIRYKTSIDVEGGELTPPLMRNMVLVTISMMDRYLPGILHVIYGNKLPEDAVNLVEGG